MLPALALALCAAAATPTESYTGHPFPPPGSKDDQALLGTLLTAQASLLNGRALAVRTMQRLHDDAVLERLEQLAAAGPAEQAARLRAVRERVERAWAADRELVARPWPVDPRIGCRQEGIQLEVLMADAARPSDDKGLVAARAAARHCLDKQRAILTPLERANEELVASAAEARAALPPRPAAPGRATQAEGAR